MNPSELGTKITTEFKGKDFLKISDYTKENLTDLVNYSIELKKMQKTGVPHQLLKGKVLAMIFEKSSMRTRVSFETGIIQLGGQALFLSGDDTHSGEAVSDTAKALSRYVDGIMIRTFGHEIVDELAENASIPIINGLTDASHPCQVLADLLTIYEYKGTFDNLKLAYVGDGNNVSQSLIMGCAIMGIDCHVAVPKNNEADPEVIKKAKARAQDSGAHIIETNDPESAVKNADIIYTDVWTSMGWQGDKTARLSEFEGYQVNEELAKHAKADYLFMHCLPAIRGEEVAAEVIDGENSVVFDQAENRLHAQKAVMATSM